jgi:CubicO group peptidase (beta-lactamase class C family)
MIIRRKTVLIQFLLLLIWLFGIPVGSDAQSTEILSRLDGSKVSAAAVDARVQLLMQTNNIQGLNLAVINRGKTVFIKSYGYRNLPAKQLLDTASIMYGASLSKGVAGVLTMKLAEKGLIDLDKPLQYYLKKPLPDYAYFSDLKNDDRWKLITARMCLSHTTGLPNLRWFHPATGVEDTAGVLRIYFQPGTKYAYSGEGFRVLQLALEEITGERFDALATQYVFIPFGMGRTGFVWHDDFGDENVAVGHLQNGLIDKKRKRTEAVAGGSMVTTIADYARFAEQLIQRKALPEKWMQEMIRPQIAIHSVTQFPPITMETTTENDAIHLSYGLGWGVFDSPYGKAFFKEGNGDSWRNYHISFTEKGLSVILLVNSENGEKVFRPLLEFLAGNTGVPWKWEGY